MTKTDGTGSGTFKESFEVLQRHARTLRDQKEPNIDELLGVVTESVAAYKVCKARIDAVEKALQEALAGAGLSGGIDGDRTAAMGNDSGH